MSAADAPALLGWVLLHFVWQGALVAALHGLAQRALAGGSARRRHDAALVALALAALLPVVTALALLHVAGVAADAAASAAAAAPLEVAAGASGLVRLAAELLRRLDGCLPALVACWAAGVALGGIRLAGGWWHLRRTMAGPRASDPLVAALAGTLGLAGVPDVVESARLTTPLVAGFRRPVLVLPRGLRARLAPAELRSVLLHELAHVARHDAALNFVQRVVETLLWFHPAVALVSAALRREREHCCDEAAVRAGERPLVLARALVTLEEWRAETPVLGLAVTGGELTLRVQRLVAPAAAGAAPRVRCRAALAGVTAVALPTLAAAVAGPLLLTAPSTAPSLLPPRVTITAEDPAGPFVLELRGGRARALTLAGVRIPSERMVQRGRTLQVLDAGGRTNLSLRIRPGGAGIEWSPRPPPAR